MTTPTKAKYILRNRMILSTDSATASPDLNTSIPFEDDSEGILDEKQPQLLIEHCNDALREELNQQKVMFTFQTRIWLFHWLKCCHMISDNKNCLFHWLKCCHMMSDNKKLSVSLAEIVSHDVRGESGSFIG